MKWTHALMLDSVQFLLSYLKYQAVPKSETASSKSFSCFEVISVSPLAPSATTSWPAMTSSTTAQLWAGEGATTTPTTPNPSITGELVVYELWFLGSLHYIFLFWHHGGFWKVLGSILEASGDNLGLQLLFENRRLLLENLSLSFGSSWKTCSFDPFCWRLVLDGLVGLRQAQRIYLLRCWVFLCRVPDF